MKSILGGRPTRPGGITSKPGVGGLFSQEGIRGPIEKPTQKPFEPSALTAARKFTDTAHAARFLLAWLSSEHDLELEPDLRTELVQRLYPLRVSGALEQLIMSELPFMTPDAHRRLLSNLLAGRWLDLMVIKPT